MDLSCYSASGSAKHLAIIHNVMQLLNYWGVEFRYSEVACRALRNVSN